MFSKNIEVLEKVNQNLTGLWRQERSSSKTDRHSESAVSSFKTPRRFTQVCPGREKRFSLNSATIPVVSFGRRNCMFLILLPNVMNARSECFVTDALTVAGVKAETAKPDIGQAPNHEIF